MERPRDYWIQREPAISDAEWATFVSSRADFRGPTEAVARTAGGAPLRISKSGFYWWLGHSSGEPFPVSLSEGGVHFASVDAEVLTFIRTVAARLGGDVVEG